MPCACTRPLLPICVSMCACLGCRSTCLLLPIRACLQPCDICTCIFQCVTCLQKRFFLSLQKDSLLSLFPRSEGWSQTGLGTVTDTAPPSVNISCTRCRVKWLDGPWAVLRISLPENPFHSPLPETSLLFLVLSRSTEILHFVLLYLLCHR